MRSPTNHSHIEGKSEICFCDLYGLYLKNLVGPKADLTAFILKTGVVFRGSEFSFFVQKMVIFHRIIMKLGSYVDLERNNV